MFDHMTQEPITVAVAETLKAAIKDRWKKFPTEKAFKAAAAKQAHVSQETVARILRAETSLRVDYLYHFAELLELTASEIVATAEALVAPGVKAQGIKEKQDGADPTRPPRPRRRKPQIPPSEPPRTHPSTGDA